MLSTAGGVVWGRIRARRVELALGHYRDALDSLTHDYEENPAWRGQT